MKLLDRLKQFTQNQILMRPYLQQEIDDFFILFLDDIKKGRNQQEAVDICIRSINNYIYKK